MVAIMVNVSVVTIVVVVSMFAKVIVISFDVREVLWEGVFD